MLRSTTILPVLLASGAAVLSTAPCSACSVPVFRYALERWQPDRFHAIVFHRGPLDAAGQAVVEKLRQATEGQPPANLTADTADLAQLDASQAEQATLLDLWRPHQDLDLPALVLIPPRGAPVQGTLWAQPLKATGVDRIADSPARREVAKRLLAGGTAVWVLLESGEREKDDEARLTLNRELRELEGRLKLPSPAADAVAAPGPELDDFAPSAHVPVRVSFSTVSVSRQDPREDVFVAMLLASESDLAAEPQVMAFPVFGRGRVLWALVGAGIAKENIAEAGEFLTGPCSCQVKSLNPGCDLLLAADWESALLGLGPPEPPAEPPPLTSVSSFSGALDPSSAAAARAEAIEDQSQVAVVLEEAVPTGAGAGTQAAEPDAGAGLWRNLLAAGAAGVLMLAGVTWLVLGRRRSPGSHGGTAP